MKRNRWFIIGLVLLMFLAGGCKSSAPNEMSYEMEKGAPAGGAVMGEPSAAPVMPSDSVSRQSYADEADTGDIPDRMVVYNADLDITVKDTVAAQEKITALAEQYQGYLSDSNSYAYENGLLRINLTLRIPAEHFDQMMADLRGMAVEVTQESISTQDVTQEYVDLDSRLKALEAKAKRLEELMDQAEDTESVLAVYQELSATQQQIEQTKGRMRYLKRSVAMATISVRLTPDEMAKPLQIAGWHPQGIAKEALQALISTMQWLVGAFIWFVIYIVPVGGILVLFFWGIVKLLIKLLRRKPPTPPAAQ